ncbi:hypothetical protein MASR2M17_07090 [Aminivibrio sp.]
MYLTVFLDWYSLSLAAGFVVEALDLKRPSEDHQQRSPRIRAGISISMDGTLHGQIFWRYLKALAPLDDEAELPDTLVANDFLS